MKPKIAFFLALIAVAFAASGCAYSSADLRATAPVFTGLTHRPLPEYAGCVQEGWLGAGISSINYIPKSDGISLSVNGIAGTDLLLDAHSSANGSRVLIFSRLPYGYDRPSSEAEKCL
ncbi:hypothetical protein [Burkholderia gladioli]|uniref:hypothetical protein n=1 Tax=Burkholderia gladioli TaxID=28095 RepID=UPI001641E8EB|nr:hypothetical protein [Burkholderia gladioli]